jgi:hypothetical protein
LSCWRSTRWICTIRWLSVNRPYAECRIMPRKNQDIRFGPTMTALRGLTCPHNTHGRQRQSCRWFSDLWRPASDWRAFDSPRAAIGSQNSWNAGVRIMPSLTAHVVVGSRVG